jgi:hypothetical protein
MTGNYKSPAPPISRVRLPSGRPIAKTGSYTHVLVHKTTELNKWSNSLPKLLSELEFLVNCGWNRDDLLIMETESQRVLMNTNDYK